MLCSRVGLTSEKIMITRDKPSSSARNQAVLRAIESLRPENERVCYDPFAGYFSFGGAWARIIKNRFLKKVLIMVCNTNPTGMVGEAVGRTRYIDDCLKTQIEDGIRQLVVLGAGYDSRAYRFPDLKGKTKVFEVDHEATQEVKIRKIKEIFGSVPDHVVYVPVDFNREELDKKLAEKGYDRTLKTFFIWEGVTMYLTAEAVETTLAFIARNSGKGSSLIFNYIYKSVVDGTCQEREAKTILKNCERIGEPLIFGLEEENIVEFLYSRGFTEVINVNGNFYKEAYFQAKKKNRKVSHCLAIVHAKVLAPITD